MQAFIVDRYGSSDVLRAGEMPEPPVGDDDVLVQVHAASINPVDFKIREGQLKLILPYRPPFILGNDLAGVVIQVGSQARRFQPGDEVYARVPEDQIGTFAERVAIREDAVALKPATLTMEAAASVPLVGLTAWQVLVDRANLKPGQSVLIHAGSGGVGTFAIQLAKHLGATVATTTSTANVDWVKRLGADVVVDYTREDFSQLPRHFDVVLDTRGDWKTLIASLLVLKPGGKLISISGPPDSDFAQQMGVNRILKLAMRLLSWRIRHRARRHRVSYSFLFMRPNGEQLREIAAIIDSGKIRPVIDRVFPFESTKEALAYVEKGHAKGKVVVNMRS